MDCLIERATIRRGKRAARFIWRCTREHCGREFPYEAVLRLEGCKATPTLPMIEVQYQADRQHEKAVRIEKDSAGRIVGLGYKR